jgi:tellurite resistance protein
LIEDAMTPEELAELQRVTRDFIERALQVAESDGVFDLDGATVRTTRG